jgi:hypothetical protein
MHPQLEAFLGRSPGVVKVQLRQQEEGMTWGKRQDFNMGSRNEGGGGVKSNQDSCTHACTHSNLASAAFAHFNPFGVLSETQSAEDT